MPVTLPPLRLTGGQILRDGRLQQRSLVIEDGTISRGPLPEIALPEYLILPGLIDLSGAPADREALSQADARCARAGVTTSWLVHLWSWEHGKDAAAQTEARLAECDGQRASLGADLRAQLRVDTHMPQDRDRILSAVVRHGVQYVTLCNALRGAEAALADGPAALSTRAARNGQTVERYREALIRAQGVSAQVPRHLCLLAEAFDRMDVTYGSFADQDGATREYFRILGARITEAPLAAGAAAMAKACNDPVLLPAGDLNSAGDSAARAVALVSRGLCDAMVSNGCPGTLARAAWALVDAGVMEFPAAWALVSQNPAEIMQLADRGTLDHGKRADVVVMHAASRRIEAVVSAGRLIFAKGEAADRLQRFLPKSAAVAA